MSMRSSTAPRRVYFRKGQPLVCYGGAYFGPGKDLESEITADKEVKIEVLDPVGGRKRVQVKQARGKKAVTETWTEKKITFTKREPRAEATA